MDTIRVAWGSATGPTAMSSFDAALAEAGVHNYNLVEVSSVVPAGAAVERAGTAPDLGPAGNGLHCVLARETLPPGADGEACAGLGWARAADGRGLFYEAGGTDAAATRRAVARGLEHGMDLRGWDAVESEVLVATEPAAPEAHASAVAVAAYGHSESLLE